MLVCLVNGLLLEESNTFLVWMSWKNESEVTVKNCLEVNEYLGENIKGNQNL